MSETKNTIYSQLARAQAKFKSAVKDSSNPHFKSKYADLASIWDACKEGLQSEGLFVSQPIVGTENGWHVQTRIYNSEGQFVESQMPIIAEMKNPQIFGSALTYARRYSLASILGIVTDDDDAEGAMNRGKQQQESQLKPLGQPIHAMNAAPAMATVQQKAEFTKLLGHELIQPDEKEAFTKWLLKPNLTLVQVAERLTRLKDNIKQREESQGTLETKKDDLPF